MRMENPDRNRSQPWCSRMLDHIPAGQIGRYLAVGAWNTVFGYGMFAAFTAVLDRRLRYGYVLATLLSSFVGITVAFLGYKWFVFRTKGNYWSEWARCVAVYGVGIAITTALLPIVVESLRHAAGIDRSAPYIGGALLTGLGIIYNFFGHRNFSFRQNVKPQDGA